MKNIKICPLLFVLGLVFCGHAAGPGILTLSGASPNTNRPGIIWVNHTVPYDPDATNFLFRAGIDLQSPEAKAVGRLVFELKQANLWTNFYAFYPMVGSTSNSCAQNLVGTNYSVKWSGTNTFNHLGVSGDGVSATGDTGFIESSTGANTNNLHLFAFSVATQSGSAGPFLGAGQANAWSAVGLVAATLAASHINTQQGDTSVALNTGCVMASRKSGTETFLAFYPPPWGYTNINFWGGIVSNSTPTTGIIGNSLKLMGNPQVGNQLTGYIKSTAGAASFGRYLSYQQATNLFNIVNTFELSLNRTHQ